MFGLINSVPPDVPREVARRLYKRLFSDIPENVYARFPYLMKCQDLFYRNVDAYLKLLAFHQDGILDELIRIFWDEVKVQAPDDYVQQLRLLNQKVRDHSQQ